MGGVFSLFFFFFGHCFKLLNTSLSQQASEVTFHKSTLSGSSVLPAWHSLGMAQSLSPALHRAQPALGRKRKTPHLPRISGLWNFCAAEFLSHSITTAKAVSTKCQQHKTLTAPFKHSPSQSIIPRCWCNAMKQFYRKIPGIVSKSLPRLPVPGTLPINSLFSAEVKPGAGIPESNLIPGKVRGGEKK